MTVRTELFVFYLNENARSVEEANVKKGNKKRRLDDGATNAKGPWESSSPGFSICTTKPRPRICAGFSQYITRQWLWLWHARTLCLLMKSNFFRQYPGGSLYLKVLSAAIMKLECILTYRNANSYKSGWPRLIENHKPMETNKSSSPLSQTGRLIPQSKSDVDDDETKVT